ncbi:MAG: hypothetical protein EBY22_13875 [Gammaproteobacteria bacterium]|nr:hypothetical protein [Gammaproteobacteria bacterium]
MPLSCNQTVVIDRVSSDVREYAIEVCPVSPGSKGLELENGDKLFWFADHVLKQCVNGTIMRWWHKPTMNDAVQYKDPSALFDFRSDGSLKARLYGVEFYWSGPIDIECSVGRQFDLVQQNGDGLMEEALEFNKMNLNS